MQPGMVLEKNVWFNTPCPPKISRHKWRAQLDGRIDRPSVSLSVHQFQAKTSKGMKMEKVRWDVGQDGVVLGVAKMMLSGAHVPRTSTTSVSHVFISTIFI